jgi:hypothetical protein
MTEVEAPRMGTKKQIRPLGPEHVFIANLAARHITGAVALHTPGRRALAMDLHASGYGSVKQFGMGAVEHFCINDAGRLWLAGL